MWQNTGTNKSTFHVFLSQTAKLTYSRDFVSVQNDDFCGCFEGNIRDYWLEWWSSFISCDVVKNHAHLDTKMVPNNRWFILENPIWRWRIWWYPHFVTIFLNDRSVKRTACHLFKHCQITVEAIHLLHESPELFPRYNVGPPNVRSWLIIPSEYGYIYHKPEWNCSHQATEPI